MHLAHRESGCARKITWLASHSHGQRQTETATSETSEKTIWQTDAPTIAQMKSGAEFSKLLIGKTTT